MDPLPADPFEYFAESCLDTTRTHLSTRTQTLAMQRAGPKLVTINNTPELEELRFVCICSILLGSIFNPHPYPFRIICRLSADPRGGKNRIAGETSIRSGPDLVPLVLEGCAPGLPVQSIGKHDRHQGCIAGEFDCWTFY